MALKEYFPEDFADRAADGSVSPRPDDTGVHTRLFSEGLRKFSNEAQYLQQLEHPNICRVVDAFMANGTAYYVSELVEGRTQLDEADGRIQRRVTLQDYLAELENSPDPLTLDEVRPLIDQLLNAVEFVHSEGPAVVLRVLGFETRTLLHRDIKPSNILVRPPSEKLDGDAAEILSDPQTVLQLIDFGSARGMAVDEGEGNTKSVAFITDAYAPPELKDNRISEQGPQSDIYSLAATFWRLLIGKQPMMTDLIGGARAVNIGAGRAPPAFLAAMDKALQMDARARPQSIADWRVDLFRAEARPERFYRLPAGPKPMLLGLVAAGLVAAVGLGVWWAASISEPTADIYRSADKAYQAGLQSVGDAEAAAAAAQMKIDTSAEAAEDAFTASEEAKYNLDTKAQIEAPVFVRNQVLTITDNIRGTRYSSWCTPDANGDVTQTYTGRHFRCSSNLGAVSELPGGTYTGPMSPWRVDVGSSVYDGHVDAGIPVQAGVLRNGDAYAALRVASVDGAAVQGLGTGRVSLADSYRQVAGQLQTTNGNSGLTAVNVEGSVSSWPDDNSWLLGRWSPTVAVGAIKRADAVISLGRRAATGDFSGQINLSDGRAFVGQSPAGDQLWWGALLRNGSPYYLGQIRAGAPEGCGVRLTEEGKRRGVFIRNGLEAPEQFRSVCKDALFVEGPIG